MNSDQEASPPRSLTRTSSLDDLRQIAQQRPKESVEKTCAPTTTSTAPRQSQPASRRVEEQQPLPPTIPFAQPAFPYTVPYPYGPPAFGFGVPFLPGMLPSWTGATAGPGFRIQKQKSLRQQNRGSKDLSQKGKGKNSFQVNCTPGDAGPSGVSAVAGTGLSSLTPQNGKPSVKPEKEGVAKEVGGGAQQEQNSQLQAKTTLQTSKCGHQNLQTQQPSTSLGVNSLSQHRISTDAANESQVQPGDALTQKMMSNSPTQNVLGLHKGGQQAMGTPCSGVSISFHRPQGEAAPIGSSQKIPPAPTCSSGLSKASNAVQHSSAPGNVGLAIEGCQSNVTKQNGHPFPSPLVSASALTSSPAGGVKAQFPCQQAICKQPPPTCVSGGCVPAGSVQQNPGREGSGNPIVSVNKYNVAGSQSLGSSPFDLMLSMMRPPCTRDQFPGFSQTLQAWNQLMRSQLTLLPGNYGQIDSNTGMMTGMVPVSSCMKQTPLPLIGTREEVQQSCPSAEGGQKLKNEGQSSNRRRMKRKVNEPELDSGEESGDCDYEPSAGTRIEKSVVRRRQKRVPGGNPNETPSVASLCEKIKSNSTEFEAQGRVLRLKQYLRPDVGTAVIDTVLDALASNTVIEALYIQNFDRGVSDAQLQKLLEVLKLNRIWALNVGENSNVSFEGWENFARELPNTAVAYLYVSDNHLQNSDLKSEMRCAIQQNQKKAPARDPDVIKHVKHMWYNPKLPGSKKPVPCALEETSTALEDCAGGLSLSLLEQPLPSVKSRTVSPVDGIDHAETSDAGDSLEVQRNLKLHDGLPGQPAPLQRRSHVPKQENTHQQRLADQGALNDGCDSGQSANISHNMKNRSTRSSRSSSTPSNINGSRAAAASAGERRMKLRSSRKRLCRIEHEDAPESKRSRDDLGGTNGALGSSTMVLGKSEGGGGGGRTTFADMVIANLIKPGMHKWTVGHEPDVEVNVRPTGAIEYKGNSFHSISSFALAVIRERNPGRRSCDGWKDVKWKGQRLEALRDQYFRR